MLRKTILCLYHIPVNSGYVNFDMYMVRLYGIAKTDEVSQSSILIDMTPVFVNM